jgi:NAD(P)H-dependent FMN reductase
MAASKLKIALIISSTRTPRVGPPVAKWVASTIAATRPSSAVLETVDLADYPLPLSPAGSVIPAKVTTPGGYGDAQVDAFSLKIAGYDGFVFVTPQYNWSIPGVLKVSLDHLFHEWAGKPAVIISYGGRGGAKAAAHLREIWQGVRGGDVAGSVELTISGPGMEKAQSKGELVEAVTETWEKEKKAEAVVESFAKLVDLVENKY